MPQGLGHDAGPFAARFLNTAVTESDDLYVTVPDFDDGSGEVRFGPVVWQPVNGRLPVAGDQAVVCEVDEEDGGFWWVLAWTPSLPPLPDIHPSHGPPVDGVDPVGFYIDVDSSTYDLYEIS